MEGKFNVKFIFEENLVNSSKKKFLVLEADDQKQLFQHFSIFLLRNFPPVEELMQIPSFEDPLRIFKLVNFRLSFVL